MSTFLHLQASFEHEKIFVHRHCIPAAFLPKNGERIGIGLTTKKLRFNT
jgi:hypothetical protein